MWMVIALILAMGPLMLILGLRHTFSRRDVEKKYRGTGPGGLGGAFDAVWSPSAHESGMERDRQQRASVPAPAPDKGPGTLEGDGRHIVIEIARD